MNGPTAAIDTLAFGGNGVSRVNGKVCFVPFSCPGDEVRLAITSEKRSYCIARITEIVTPSPSRVTPPCPVFGTCGGCSWQHIDYPQQLQAKRQILVEALWRGARVPDECVGPALPSPDPYGYRSRVQFKVQGTAGRLRIGFYRNNSHQVEDIGSGCAIAVPVVNSTLAVLRVVLDSCPNVSSISQVSVDSAEQGVIAVITYSGRDVSAVSDYFRKRCAELQPLTGLYLQTGRKPLLKLFGDNQLSYDLPQAAPEAPACRLTYQPGGFSQVNRPQNRVILDIVRRMACFEDTAHVLDLYCGNGNFSLPIAGEVARVTGIEEHAGSIVSAEANRAANGIGNVEFICADAVSGLKELVARGCRFDTIIIDPPRAGAAEVVTELFRLNPSRIIYVSCDPSTLARDCGLLAGSGYTVRESVPVDMFPQTYHLESVTLLQKQ